LKKNQYVPAELRRRTFQRAAGRCEYCLLPLALDVAGPAVEHIIPRKHRGKTISDNLAAACSHCNLHKGSDAAGIDPLTDRLCRLYDPRKDVWKEHFRFLGATIVGRSPIGRTTVYVLAMNDAVHLVTRESLIAEGRFDPF
jgi:hypothetical protein